jgi:serine/threonine protein kinase
LLQPGQQVADGAYRILRLLGQGGMGAVYLAANTKAFDRPCVVKEVIEYYDPSDAEKRRQALQRFEAEARTLAALKHPNIPDVYAYFSRKGRNYLVMEYIEGRDLSSGLTRRQNGQIVQGSPQPLDDVIRHVIEICGVLAYLEEQRPPVIHNDIKPANIILDKNTGRAVLVDFGTAKMRYAARQSGQPGRPRVYSTIGYAAPELYEGKAEPRSDVFSLAATAYHLLTDDDPRAHPLKFPRLGDLPQPIRAILATALAVDVDKRPTAAHLRVTLQAALQHRSNRQQALGLHAKVARPRLYVLSLRVIHNPILEETSEIVVANTGTGDLRGTATSQQPWVKLPRQFLCAEGQTATLPLDIDVTGLQAGQTHHAEVKITSSAIKGPATVRVEVRVPAPELEVTPAEVDLGAVSRRQEFSDPALLRVHNVGQSRAACRVESNAPWLVPDPFQFACVPGQTQIVELGAQTTRLPRGKVHETTLRLNVEGGRSHAVRVSLQTSKARHTVRRAVVLGVSIAAVLSGLAWLAYTFLLPMLAL